MQALAYIATAKNQDAIPLYRIENIFVALEYSPVSKYPSQLDD